MPDKLDKLTLGFLVDVLYLKGVICIEELEAVYECRNAVDLENVFNKMVKEEYNVYKRLPSE